MEFHNCVGRRIWKIDRKWELKKKVLDHLMIVFVYWLAKFLRDKNAYPPRFPKLDKERILKQDRVW